MRFQYSKGRLWRLLALFLLLGSAIRAQASGVRAADYGADLEIGGAGAGYGKFAGVSDMAFDKNNTLYVLDTAWNVNGANRANYLIQKFSDAGQFQSQYSIYDARLGANNGPAHIALDAPGNLYLTQPRAGLVRQYNSSGVLVRDFALPAAFSVAVRTLNNQEQILVVPLPNGQSVQQVSVFYADGRTGTPIHLSRAVTNCYSLATDKSGCLYALADVNQVYKFDPNGVLLTILGQRNSRRPRHRRQRSGEQRSDRLERLRLFPDARKSRLSHEIQRRFDDRSAAPRPVLVVRRMDVLQPVRALLRPDCGRPKRPRVGGSQWNVCGRRIE